MGHDNLAIALYSERFEIAAERKVRIGCGKLRKCRRIVLPLHVTALDTRPGIFGKRLLYLHRVGCPHIGIVNSREFENFGKKFEVTCFKFRVTPLHIVVAVTHSEPGLTQVENVVVALNHVSHHIRREERTVRSEVHCGNFAHQGIFV